MKTKIKSYISVTFIILTIFILFQSCTEKDNKIFSTQYIGLVVEGAITTDTTVHTVILKKSNDPENKVPVQFISKAIVTISDGKNIFPLTENPDKKGYYNTLPNVYGIPGNNYTLNISNVDVNNDGVMETYSASSLLRNELPVDSISFFYQKFSPDFKGLAVNLYAQDIGAGRDYYLIKIKKNSELITDSLYEYSIANNSGFEGKYYDGISVYFLNETKPDELVKPGDTITLELNGITEDYFNFITGIITEYQPKNPIFSGPSANVVTNLTSSTSNNVSGFFAAYSIKRKTRIYQIPQFPIPK